MVEPLFYALLVAVGGFAGFLNVMAGGGSLLALPVLLLMGVPAATANGTVRVAILVQNVVAVNTFRAKGVFDARRSLVLSLLTLPGAVAGALVAVTIPDQWFRVILAVVIVLALFGLLAPTGPRKRTQPRITWPVIASLVAIGFYGGFIQAGVGMLFMVALYRLAGFDLVHTNYHKVFIVLVYTLPALAVFVLTSNVDWIAGGALAVGNAMGVAVGARTTIRGGERAVRFVVAIALVIIAWRLIAGAG